MGMFGQGPLMDDPAVHKYVYDEDTGQLVTTGRQYKKAC